MYDADIFNQYILLEAVPKYPCWVLYNTHVGSDFSFVILHQGHSTAFPWHVEESAQLTEPCKAPIAFVGVETVRSDYIRVQKDDEKGAQGHRGTYREIRKLKGR